MSTSCPLNCLSDHIGCRWVASSEWYIRIVWRQQCRGEIKSLAPSADNSEVPISDVSRYSDGVLVNNLDVFKIIHESLSAHNWVVIAGDGQYRHALFVEMLEEFPTTLFVDIPSFGGLRVISVFIDNVAK